jgi:hypothetical protein
VQYRFGPWQLAAALIALCAVVVGAVVWLRQSRSFTTPEQLASLPSGPGAVLFLDAAALRDAGVLDAFFGKTVNEEADYRNFVAQTGFDYKTDLDQALVKFTDSGTYMVVNGRFDWARIMRYGIASGGSCHNSFCRIQGSQPDRLISFYPLRTHVLALAVGPNDYAAQSIRPGSSRSAAPGPLPFEPVWFKAPTALIRDSDKLPAGTRQFARLLDKEGSVLMTLGPGPAGFIAGVEVDCKNAEDAAVLKTQLEDLTSLLRKMVVAEAGTPNPTDLSGILIQGGFERRDHSVIGRWPVPPVFLTSLATN